MSRKSAQPAPAFIPKPRLSLGLQPAVAWIAILGLFLLTILAAWAGLGKVLRFGFPLGAVAVGVLLYWRYPILYIGFTWWLWFLTPWLRRLADYRSSFDPMGLMSIASYGVTFVAIATLMREFPKAHRRGNLPFFLAAIAVLYGFAIGAISNPMATVLRTLLDWLCPILFGFHLSATWRNYPQMRQNLQRVFLWGVLVMGIYGVVQYLVAPGWDIYWMGKVEKASFGRPIPLGIRVWSTMNSPVAFASTMLAGLLLLFTHNAALRIPAAIAGYLAFLLSLVRSAWGGWFVGLFVLVSSLKSHLQIRLLVTILVLAACVLSLSAIAPFSDIIQTRLETFSNLGADGSLLSRLETYQDNLSLALSSIFGRGLGATWILLDNGQIQRVAFDSGLLDLFFSLGWFGAVPYVGGILLLLRPQFQGVESRFDPAANAARAIAFSLFVMLALGSFMVGAPGMIFWSFLGLGTAARKYYRQQNYGMM